MSARPYVLLDVDGTLTRIIDEEIIEKKEGIKQRVLWIGEVVNHLTGWLLLGSTEDPKPQVDGTIIQGMMLDRKGWSKVYFQLRPGVLWLLRILNPFVRFRLVTHNNTALVSRFLEPLLRAAIPNLNLDTPIVPIKRSKKKTIPADICGPVVIVDDYPDVWQMDGITEHPEIRKFVEAPLFHGKDIAAFSLYDCLFDLAKPVLQALKDVTCNSLPRAADLPQSSRGCECSADTTDQDVFSMPALLKNHSKLVHELQDAASPYDQLIQMASLKRTKALKKISESRYKTVHTCQKESRIVCHPVGQCDSLKKTKDTSVIGMSGAGGDATSSERETSRLSPAANGDSVDA